MNIFVLDANPRAAAKAHCDSHVRKMVVETAQLLSTAHHMLGNVRWVSNAMECRDEPWIAEGRIYKETHRNHPCALWVRESCANYGWAHALGTQLAAEFRARFGKKHATEDVLHALRNPPAALDAAPWLTPFVKVVPDRLKHLSAVDAYRALYMAEKRDLAVWTNAKTPSWFK